MYNPVPIKMDGLELSPQMNMLVNKIASSVHDSWAAERIRQGWQWGPCRNDKLKTTPCLVPFDELPLSEQEYDIITAATVVKHILEEGYDIVPRDQR